MRIGLIAPPWVTVPPQRYGGTEQVVDNLARGLVARGHDVRLFSVGTSTCAVPRESYFDDVAAPMGAALPEAAHVLAAYDALADVDVIHDHTVLGAIVAQSRPSCPPVVVTNHGIYSREARTLFGRAAAELAIVAISRSQRASAPEIPIAAVIHHGIDLQTHPYGPGDGGFLMFIGRMSPDKGVHRAIHVARRTGLPIVVMSKMREAGEHEYFDSQVRPLLGPDVTFYDEPSTAERIALLRQAIALLNPITWPEPFGLVMAEALACGTPVLAFPHGAAPEIVEHGRTGFLCASENEMVDALASIDSIRRRDCRAAAETRFAMSRMATDHERLYRKVIERRRTRLAVM